MTPANRIPIEPGDRVLDVCAAPGGKATELGAKLKGRGILIANDISNSRARGLLKNLELFGIGNMCVISEEPGKLIEHFPGYFDKILIDAPCSGEGMFRKEKKMVKAWEEHGPEFFSKLQRSIVTQAAQMLRPGGMLLYSTCTFDPLENEQTIEYLLDCCPEFELCEIPWYEGFMPGRPEYTKEKKKEFEKTVRIFPHRMKGEGHYLALLKKGADSDCKEWEGTDKGCTHNISISRDCQKEGKPGFKTINRKIPEEFSAFLRDISWEWDYGRMDFRDERVYYMPQGLPDLKGIRFLRSGLLLGELKKNRFEPSQALAMCLKKDEYKKIIDLKAEDERVVRYLKGETLDVEDLVSSEEKGWYLVCVDSYPLGFGKLSSHTLKNKYLPGWRMM